MPLYLVSQASGIQRFPWTLMPAPGSCFSITGCGCRGAGFVLEPWVCFSLHPQEESGEKTQSRSLGGGEMGKSSREQVWVVSLPVSQVLMWES